MFIYNSPLITSTLEGSSGQQLSGLQKVQCKGIIGYLGEI